MLRSDNLMIHGEYSNKKSKDDEFKKKYPLIGYVSGPNVISLKIYTDNENIIFVNGRYVNANTLKIVLTDLFGLKGNGTLYSNEREEPTELNGYNIGGQPLAGVSVSKVARTISINTEEMRKITHPPVSRAPPPQTCLIQ